MKLVAKFILIIFILLIILVFLALVFFYPSMFVPDSVERYFAKKTPIKFVYLDYDCKPIPNAELKIQNWIEIGGYLSRSPLLDSENLFTDKDGIITTNLYQGHSATVIHVETSHKLTDKDGNIATNLNNGLSATVTHDETILKVFNKVDLTWVNNNKKEEDNIALYKRSKLNDIKIHSFRGWVKEPSTSIYPTRSKKTEIEIAAFEISRWNRRMNSSSIDTAKGNKNAWLIISAESKGEGYILKIRGNNDTEVMLPNVSRNDVYGDIPTSGYSKSINFYIPNKFIQYEDRADWIQQRLYVKHKGGESYSIVSLDLGLVSPHDQKHHNSLLVNSERKGISNGNDPYTFRGLEHITIWGHVEMTYSDILLPRVRRTYVDNYKIIENPIIVEERCQSLLNRAESGHAGRHPLPSEHYLRFRNERVNYMNSEIEKEKAKVDGNQKQINDTKLN